MRLSTRFAVFFAALVPVLVLLSGVLMVALIHRDLGVERDRQLVVRLNALKPLASAYAWRTRLLPVLPAQSLRRRLADGAEGPGGMRLEIPGADPLIIGDVPDAPPPPGVDGPADIDEGGRVWRYVATDLGRSLGGARLWVFDPAERLAEQRALLVRRLALTSLLAVGVAAAAGLALGRLGVRPLVVLHRQARAIDTPARAGDRLATSSRVVEIDELAALVNILLDRRDAAVARTGEALEAARAFAASAAHELRTPLTSMGTNLDLLTHPDLGPADRAEVIADLRAEHGRMQRLITMLRGLARGELLDRESFTAVDPAEIVADAVDDARCRHPHAEITARLVPDLTVQGWAEGFRMIVDNLLDNAALHGVDEDGRAVVAVTLAAADGAVVLSVRDHGPGIPADERAAVFDRFHRRPDSPGSGLGLTLIRQQALLHGGAVAVTAPPHGPGAVVEVRLPAAGQAPEDGAPRSRPV